MNQKYNIVKAVKNAIIKIKKDRELKGNLESKEWENAFTDIKKPFKITYKINKIKVVRDIVKKKQGEEFLEGPYKLFYIYYILKSIYIFINQVKKSQASKADVLEMVNNVILNRLELSKAGILRTLYLISLDFLTAYKFRSIVNEELVKKQKLVYYLSQGYRFLVLALTIKIKEEEFALKPVTPAPLLLFFKKVKGLNAKILCSSFLFKSKVSKAKGEDLEFDGSTSLKNIFIISSL